MERTPEQLLGLIRCELILIKIFNEMPEHVKEELDRVLELIKDY